MVQAEQRKTKTASDLMAAAGAGTGMPWQPAEDISYQVSPACNNPSQSVQTHRL